MRARTAYRRAMKSRFFGSAFPGRFKSASAADRYKNGEVLARHGIDWFVLDDGFQHLKLARDADIVLVDATDPFGGGMTLPAGRLREPVSALRRADVVVITRSVQAPVACDRGHDPAPHQMPDLLRDHATRKRASRSAARGRPAAVRIGGAPDSWLSVESEIPPHSLKICASGDFRLQGSGASPIITFTPHGKSLIWNRRRQIAEPMPCSARKKMCGISAMFSSRRLPVYCCRISLRIAGGVPGSSLGKSSIEEKRERRDENSRARARIGWVTL